MGIDFFLDKLGSSTFINFDSFFSTRILYNTRLPASSRFSSTVMLNECRLVTISTMATVYTRAALSLYEKQLSVQTIKSHYHQYEYPVDTLIAF